MSVQIDMTGQKFGRLTVIAHAYYDSTSHQSIWKCQCSCGKITYVNRSNLIRGMTKSCGCYNIESLKRCKTHGFNSKDRLYRIWSGIKSRCYNKFVKIFDRYGGRGIKMCDEWKNDFMAFREWAISTEYNDNLSIDRIDNDGDYCPENCRWATRIIQCNNRRTNVFITYNGEVHTLAEWSRITGIKELTLASRKRNGWTDKECIEVPVSQENNQTTRKKLIPETAIVVSDDKVAS